MEFIVGILFLTFLVSLGWLFYANKKSQDKQKPAIVAIVSFTLIIVLSSIYGETGKTEQHEQIQVTNPDCSIDEVVDYLTLYYINHRIYKPVDCEAEEINDNWFVFCHPPLTKIGGLYLVKFKPDCSYTLFAVNGKAKSHAEKGGIAIPIYIPALKRMTGLDDISKILEEF